MFLFIVHITYKSLKYYSILHLVPTKQFWSKVNQQISKNSNLNPSIYISKATMIKK